MAKHRLDAQDGACEISGNCGLNYLVGSEALGVDMCGLIPG
jgi:hypothetical protein